MPNQNCWWFGIRCKLFWRLLDRPPQQVRRYYYLLTVSPLYFTAILKVCKTDNERRIFFEESNTIDNSFLVGVVNLLSNTCVIKRAAPLMSSLFRLIIAPHYHRNKIFRFYKTILPRPRRGGGGHTIMTISCHSACSISPGTIVLIYRGRHHVRQIMRKSSQ